MATLGHLAVGLAAGRLYTRRAPVRLSLAMAAFSALSFLPDADVVAFALGIPYAAPLGHRGAAHSLAFAAAVGLGVGVAGRAARLPLAWTAALAAATVASHGLLDTLTDGGLGIALGWPFTDARYFAPWQPLPVAPIGLRFASARGLSILLAELVVFLPLLVWALWPRAKPR